MENKQTPAPEQAPEIKEGFFLRRPIFSTVISLIITLVGAIAISVLPVEQYPDLTPPQVEVNATYTGASANVIAETVASLPLNVFEATDKGGVKALEHPLCSKARSTASTT